MPYICVVKKIFMKSIITSFVLILGLISCQNTAQNHQANQTQSQSTETPASQPFSLATGKVLDSVPLSFNKQYSMALYLPNGYTPGREMKTILFFDPHGSGNFPLNIYKGLADEYNCILIGSNDSKNGVSFDKTSQIANDLIAEAQTRFHTKSEDIVLCGFSGGAKVALYNGMQQSNISTVIYCGAAIDINPPANMKLLGFVGKKDMNYTDVVQFERGLQNSPAEHYLIQWNGHHQFPTADVFRDAFEFIFHHQVPDYAEKQATISPQEVALEQQQKNMLIQAFQQKDLSWWKDEVKKLASDSATSEMDARLLGFISLACYSLGNRALQQNQLNTAEKIIAIYRIADPENEAHEEFAAELKKKRGQ